MGLDLEVDLFFELFGFSDLDDFILGIEGFLDEVEGQIEPGLHEFTLVVRMSGLIHEMCDGIKKWMRRAEEKVEGAIIKCIESE